MKTTKMRIMCAYSILVLSITFAYGVHANPLTKVRTILSLSGQEPHLIDSLFQHTRLETITDGGLLIQNLAFYAGFKPDGTFGSLLVTNVASFSSFADRNIDIAGARQIVNQIAQLMEKEPFQIDGVRVWQSGELYRAWFRWKLPGNVDLEANWCNISIDKRTGIPTMISTKLGATKWPLISPLLREVLFSQNAMQARAMNYYYQHSPFESFRFVSGKFRFGIPRFGQEFPLNSAMQEAKAAGNGVSFYALSLKSIQSVEFGMIDLFVCCRTGQVLGCVRSRDYDRLTLGSPSTKIAELETGTKFRTLTASTNKFSGGISPVKVKAEMSKSQVVVLSDEQGRLFEFDWNAKLKVLSDKRTSKQWKPDSKLVVMIEQLTQKW